MTSWSRTFWESNHRCKSSRSTTISLMKRCCNHVFVAFIGVEQHGCANERTITNQSLPASDSVALVSLVSKLVGCLWSSQTSSRSQGYGILLSGKDHGIFGIATSLCSKTSNVPFGPRRHQHPFRRSYLSFGSTERRFLQIRISLKLFMIQFHSPPNANKILRIPNIGGHVFRNEKHIIRFSYRCDPTDLKNVSWFHPHILRNPILPLLDLNSFILHLPHPNLTDTEKDSTLPYPHRGYPSKNDPSHSIHHPTLMNPKTLDPQC